jgi:hypothetical protein
MCSELVLDSWQLRRTAVHRLSCQRVGERQLRIAAEVADFLAPDA